jgi:hypothetical protein
MNKTAAFITILALFQPLPASTGQWITAVWVCFAPQGSPGLPAGRPLSRDDLEQSMNPALDREIKLYEYDSCAGSAPPAGTYACHVTYTKNGTTTDLYRAEHEPTYCYPRAQALAGKLETAGYNCHSADVQNTCDDVAGVTGIPSSSKAEPEYRAGVFLTEDESLSPVAKSADEAIRKAETEHQSWLRDCSFIGSPVDLGGDETSSYLAVTTRKGCSWGAADAPIWVLRNNAGRYSVILSASGSSLKPVEPERNGLLGITISTDTTGWRHESHWSFDGTRYSDVRKHGDAGR